MPDEQKPTDEKPDTKPADDPKPAAVFKTPEEWARARKRLQSEGAKESVSALLAKLGVESEDQIDEIKAKLEATQATQTEAEKLKNTLDKQGKEAAKLAKQLEELRGFKARVQKGEAMAPLASRFRAAADMDAYLAPLLAVDEDGKVTGPEGKSIEDTVAALLEKHTHLRAPDFKAGPGTSSRPPKGSPQPGTNGTQRRLTPEEARANLVHEMQRIADGTAQR